MAVTIKFGFKTYQIEEGLTIDPETARSVMANYYPEVENAEVKTYEDENGRVIEFVKRSGRLG